MTNNNTNANNNDNINTFQSVDKPIDFNSIAEITARSIRYRELTWKDYADSVSRWLDLKRDNLNLIESVIGVLREEGVEDPRVEVNKILNKSDALIKDDVQGIVDAATDRIQRKVEDKIGDYPYIEVMEYDKHMDCSVPTYYPDDDKVDEWEEKNKKEWEKLYPEWAYIVAEKLYGLLSTTHYS